MGDCTLPFVTGARGRHDMRTGSRGRRKMWECKGVQGRGRGGGRKTARSKMLSVHGPCNYKGLSKSDKSRVELKFARRLSMI